MAIHQTKPANKPKMNGLPHLLNFDQIDGRYLPVVGGKAFRLAKLKQQGFNVPPGLVLTTHFFEAQLKHAHLVPLWAGSPDIAVTVESLGWLADSLKTTPLSKALATALNNQVDQLFDPSANNFAVRSSVIDEDQRDHTFAGVHLSELGVPRSALAISISRCWSSALSGPAIKYRQVHGMSIQTIKIAVFIQPMLTPETSGVGFTINPLTGARNELVIEAVWGLGSALVSGDVQPFFYRLSHQPPQYALIEQRPGDSLPANLSAHQTADGPLLPQTRTHLAQQLEQIEALMGGPQDVEWACQDDTIYILQTRPVLAVQAAPQPPDQVWTRVNFSESLPELPSPLYGSMLERSQPEILQRFAQFGLSTNTPTPFEKVMLGRPYLNLTFLKRVAAQSGLNVESFLQTIDFSAMPGSTFSVDWPTAWQARPIYRRLYRYLKQAPVQVEQARATVNHISRQLAGTPPTEAISDTLVNQVREQERLYTVIATTKLTLDMGIALFTALGSYLAAPTIRAPATLVTTLALQNIKSTQDDLHQQLKMLAQQAAVDKPVQDYLLNAPNDFADFSHNPAISTQFRQQFEALLARFGRRAVFEADPAQPRYADAPETLLRLIRQYSKTKAHHADSAFAAEYTIPSSLAYWRRLLLKVVIRRLRELLALRYQMNDSRAQGMAACRAWDLGLGKQWVKKNWLEQPEDIFWLTLAEIERTLMAGAEVAVTLPSTIKARKETYQGYAQTTMPVSLQESQLSAIQLGLERSPDAPSDVTVGLPVSPGQTRGSVTVVRRPDEFDRFPPDTILVMPSTGPDWLPLLHLAAGLIVETGGLLSHGSVIAREYGLPAVANIPRATQLFNTGDQVLVDGSTGVIQLLETVRSNNEARTAD